MNKLSGIITFGLFICLLSFIFSDIVTENPSLSTRQIIDKNIYRFDYLSNDGDITVHPIMHYATLIQIVDDENQVIEEYYYDEQGNPVKNNAGYFGVRRVYQNGVCIRYTYVGIDGNPVIASFGYASVKQVFNDEKQLIEVYYFDVDGRPIANINGQYGERLEYDDNGLNYCTICLDSKGIPIENKEGYSTIIRDYTPDDRIDIDWYYNLSGEHVDIGRGQYGTKHIYTDGTWTDSVPVGINGQIIVHFDSFLSNNPWIIGVVAIALIIMTLFLPKRIRIAVLIAYILFILILTLLIREPGDTNHNYNLFWSYRLLFRDRNLAIQVLSNIWLFIPLGAMLA